VKRLLFLALLLVAGWQLSAQLAFADSLYAHHEYYRAITEYQRSFYTGEQRDYCHARIRDCYYRGGDYDGLEDYLAGSNDPADHIYYSFAHLKQDRPDLAAIINDSYDASYRIALIAYSNDYLGKFREAGQMLGYLDEESYLPLKQKLQQIDREVQDQHYLSPALAGALGIVPGAGYAYGGAWQTAFSALATNALLWGVVYELESKELYFSSGALAAAGMSFYLGSIYGSVNHAAKRNRETRKKVLDKYQDELFRELLELSSTR